VADQFSVSDSGEISYTPPTGFPLGTNRTFAICAGILIPIIKLFVRRDWRGIENIPKSGPAIVASNHLSYSDPILFAQFLYLNGRAPRFLGKRSVFEVPVIGKILLAAGQIPVDRESKDATKALEFAVAVVNAGHLIGIYPEGTLTRDEQGWPMIAKTGIARLAIITQTPVIPVAAWGPQKVLPTYGKIPHLFPRTKVTHHAGPAIDMSPWYGKSDDQQALIEATAHIMRTITLMLEQIRGEVAPAKPFDPHASDLPRVGNFKKAMRGKK